MHADAQKGKRKYAALRLPALCMRKSARVFEVCLIKQRVCSTTSWCHSLYSSLRPETAIYTSCQFSLLFPVSIIPSLHLSYISFWSISSLSIFSSHLFSFRWQTTQQLRQTLISLGYMAEGRLLRTIFVFWTSCVFFPFRNRSLSPKTLKLLQTILLVSQTSFSTLHKWNIFVSVYISPPPASDDLCHSKLHTLDKATVSGEACCA